MQLFGWRQAAPVDPGQAYRSSHLPENEVHCDMSFGVSQDGELPSGEHNSEVGGVDGWICFMCPSLPWATLTQRRGTNPRAAMKKESVFGLISTTTRPY